MKLYRATVEHVNEYNAVREESFIHFEYNNRLHYEHVDGHERKWFDNREDAVNYCKSLRLDELKRARERYKHAWMLVQSEVEISTVVAL
jgi:hypothetical protein